MESRAHRMINRFDDPRRAFGVLYAGKSEACAFIESRRR
jgi:hypothetical protein